MKKTVTTIFTCLLGAASVFATQPSSNLTAEQALQKTDKQFFIENKGQWHSDVLYLTRMGGLDVWITKYGVNYTFYQIEKNPNAKNAEHLPGKFDREMEDASLLGHRVLLKLQNHNAHPQREGKQKQEGYYNYLIGNDPSKHASYVGLYKEAIVKNVYKGIDLRYYFDKGYLRYDFLVQPGADPAQIRFSLEGEDKEYLKNGALCYTTRFGEVQMQDLYVYQQNDKKHVPAKFTQQNGVWQFQLSGYDKTQPLIIDPLIYSTYIGGNNLDFGSAIVIDNSGNAYITGWTKSTNYDITSGAFQTTIQEWFDVFVTKLNSTGTGLIYSTYLGGNGDEYSYAIAIDDSDNAYITGSTWSTNYDITSGAFQTTNAGDHDVFVTKLNSTGTGLIYSTYLGGSDHDSGRAIAIDNSGNAFIAGVTYSTNYHITSGAFQNTHEGAYDVFVTKLNSTGNGLIYSTYIGGNNGDEVRGITIGDSDNVYITGFTSSTDYDITSGAYQTTFGGLYDVFVTKLNSTGTSLIYSTYVGGSDEDLGISIAIDGSDNAYITGYTKSIDYDTTPGAFQTALAGAWDVFVTKLNSTGTALIYSTYIGGSSSDHGRDIAIDGSGNAYITGSTFLTDYDITSDAFQTDNAGDWDVFVTKLNNTGTALIYSTYIGGSEYDGGYSIAIDGSGNAYITGETWSTDYDITAGTYQTTFGGEGDVFVTKLCFNPSQPETIIGDIIVCAGSSQTYSVTPVTGSTSYSWTLPGGWSGSSTTNTINTTVGINTGIISVVANNECGSSIAQTLSVSVDNSLPSQPGSINGDTVLCAGSTQTFSVVAVSGPSTYTWTLPSGWTGSSTTDSIQVSAGSNGGTITVIAHNGCGSSPAQTINITVNPLPNVTANASATTICQGNQVILTGSGAASYSWDNGVTNGVAFTPTATTTYTVTGTDANGCSDTDQVTVTVNALPNVSANASATSVCAGGQVTLSGSGATTYTWTGGVINGVAFTPTNTATYTLTGTDANGCSNTDQVTVTVNPLPDVTVSNNSNTLTANQSGATYQWIDCNNNNAPISGATNKSYTPATSGSYAVIVTLNGCSDTSACQTVTITGLDTQASSKLPFSIYPNPNHGTFTIQSTKGGVFELIDVTGKVINTYTSINTQQTVNENIPAGMYFVREKESGSVQKLIIE
jgi:hypothetical protein